ncbi:hypothetical protein HKX69_22190 [Streptomyces argyrophyllae]|uniref:LppX_LprAFG lipoprotein n=1 Tax=Streptomyces argyrophylli TaxID=2726118 RepID=A0A6M4PKX2_9ACTN|nr:hypothetical protein [Streptomyces argyrophyllae]QJS11865.1 hypothetical protein HKX69_22190 [Streptomyces argyrophyllae]
MRKRHTAAWVAFTAAALVAASGCGTESARTAVKAVDKADQAMAALTRATDRTERLGSAEVRMTTDTGTSGPIAMKGTYSWGGGYAFDVEMDTKAANMQAMNHSPTTHVLFVDGVYYYDVDRFPSGPYEGKDWIRIDGSVLFGKKGAQALSGDNGSPSASMKGLKYAKDVQNLGTQTVNGKRTTHYRGVIDSAHMGKLKDVYGEGSPMSKMTGTTSIPMDVWVGPDDLPVRLREKIGAMTISMDFDKFGRTATVKAPPAGRVADLTDVIEKQQSRQG